MLESEMRRLAPPAPACFEARDIWLEYVITAQQTKEQGMGTRPFLASGAWNPSFNYCAECTRQHEAAMRREGRCVRPRVIRIEVVRATAVPA